MEVWFRYSYDHTLINIAQDFQIYVTQGYAAQFCHVEVYKLQLCPRAQPGTFYGRWRFAKKRAQYMEGIIATLYLWYIIPRHMWQS